VKSVNDEGTYTYGLYILCKLLVYIAGTEALITVLYFNEMKVSAYSNVYHCICFIKVFLIILYFHSGHARSVRDVGTVLGVHRKIVAPVNAA